MFALFAFVGAVFAAMPAPARAAGPKVVIIVGPVGTLTPQYIGYANETATAATAAGATVVKVYSPKATAAAVLTAVAGANIIVYYGHGSGFPNPYSTTLDPNGTNGWGLQGPNAKGTHEDNWSNGTLKYYGEAWISANARPAPGFVMVYANACYAPGASEGWDTPATESVAKTRVGYYSRAPLNMGAGAYFATDLGASSLVSRLITQRTTAFGDIFKMERSFSETALRRFNHPHVTNQQVWLHKAANWSGQVNYWYAFAGNPNRTPSGTTISPVKYPLPSTLDTTAPRLTSWLPGTSHTGVATSATVRVTFSEAVTGVWSGSFTLQDGATYITSTVTYDAATRSAVLTPSAPLTPGRTYKVALTSRIKDASGNMLAYKSWTFTTATTAPVATIDTTAPRVTTKSPAPSATAVATTSQVRITFSEPVTSVWTGSFTLQAGTTYIPATVTYDPATRSAVLTPSAPLAAGQVYKVGVTTRVKDLAGNPLAWTTWSFTTAP